uniref:Uncharacterized protein n=1 Tax=Odontella aurita TaxID=265563 RepID=A0A7S4JEK1_9STRA|mmetsp:Transcript_44961/g.137323  ORF Transcript_44961/g.137323 Transcript_44961/m.137323 type:complete len:120 (+) Transcript_44961:689-1048(+)
MKGATADDNNKEVATMVKWPKEKEDGSPEGETAGTIVKAGGDSSKDTQSKLAATVMPGTDKQGEAEKGKSNDNDETDSTQTADGAEDSAMEETQGNDTAECEDKDDGGNVEGDMRVRRG